MKFTILIGMCTLLIGCSYFFPADSRCVIDCLKCNDDEICVSDTNYMDAFCPYKCVKSNFTVNFYNVTNEREWERIWYNSNEYMKCCADKQFEEIPNNETYCRDVAKYNIYCNWDKGQDEKWREYCYTVPISTEECFVKRGNSTLPSLST